LICLVDRLLLTGNVQPRRRLRVRRIKFSADRVLIPQPRMVSMSGHQISSAGRSPISNPRYA
jgi:hypothetical protein